MKQLILLFTLAVILPQPTTAQNIPSYVPTNGLVGWWPFNGNANDESGNGNNGTVNGATLTTDRFGNNNSAYTFDKNATQNILVNSSNSLNNCTEFSANIWVYLKSNSINHWNRYVNKGSTNTGGYQYVFANNWTGVYYYYNNPFYQTNTLPPLNSWHMISVTYRFQNNQQNNYCKFYVDGIMTDSFPTTTAIIPNNGDLSIGSEPNSSDCTPDGKLDDIGIWNRALTQQEITNLYNASTPATTCPTLPSNLQSGLVGYWPFCGNANDESGNGNDGTVNGATLTTDRFGNNNKAYSFDGIDDNIQVNSNFYNIANPHTLCMWVLISDIQMIGQYLWNTTPHGGEAFVYNWYNTTNSVTYCLGNGQSGWSITCGGQQTPLPTSPNVWLMYTMTYSSGLWSIYLNGQLSDTFSSPNLPSGIFSLVFGDITPSISHESINGKLDDICIWNRALSATEVSQLYAAQSVNPTNNSSSGSNGNSVSTNFPSGISYQAVTRDSVGQSLSNTPITVRFTLRDSSISGTAVYTETHSVTTNSLGLFTAVIGSGTPVQGTYSSINWMGPQKFLSVEIDSGSGFQLIGSQQLLSVPYANAADKASRIKNASLPVYTDNAAATAGGLQPGDSYRTPTGVFMIVY